MLFRMKDEKAHQLEAELDKLQADGPAAWAKLPEEELFTPAGFSEERAEATSYSNYSYWGSTFRAFFKNRVAVLLLVALIAVVAFAFLQPCLPGQADPNLCAVDPATGIQYRNIAPGEKGFIWGSNAIGQDLWARIWAGARTSLTIAFFVALIEAVVGITVGVLWGYVRQLDFFFTELYNICDNVPSTIILILISYVASPSVQTLILGMSITGWIAMARFIRNQILIIRDRDYNVASRCIGTPTSRIVVRNLLPYLVSVIMLRMALTIPAAIGSEVFITYIGLGLSVEVPSLGNLINDGRKVMMQAGLHHDLAAIVDEVAQRRHLDREAEADVGDEDLAADGGGDGQGHAEHDDRHEVGQQVAHHDAGGGGADAAGCHVVVTVTDDEDLVADKTRHGDPARDGHAQDQRLDAGAGDIGNKDQDDGGRHVVADVVQLGEEEVQLTDIAPEHTHRDAHHGLDEGYEESDGQAGAGAGPDAGPEVLADGVGTPDEALFTGGDVAVLDAGGGVHGAEVGVCLTGQAGLQKCKGHHGDEGDEQQHGHAVLEEGAEGAAPVAVVGVGRGLGPLFAEPGGGEQLFFGQLCPCGGAVRL